MNIYAIQFEKLDSKDLRRILNDHISLVLPAKKALVERLENFPEQDDFDPEKIVELKHSIVEEKEEINKLQYIDWLGYSLIKRTYELGFIRNDMSIWRDVIGILLGFAMSLLVIPAIVSLFTLTKDFSMPTLIPFLIFSIVGGIGIALFVKALDRFISLSKFLLIKRHNEIVLKGGVISKTAQNSFPLDSKLATRQHNGDTFLVLQTSDGEEPIDLIKFSKLEPVLQDSLIYITDKFNNWPG